MFDKTGERHLLAFLRATRSAIDPNRNILSASTPYVVAGDVKIARRELIAAGAFASHNVGADYIHLEFKRGAEAEGPVNVKVGMVRFDIVTVRENCRFWLGEDGRLLLVATAGAKTATMSFDPDGLDSRPGRPGGDLESGYARAAARLSELASKALASNDFGSVYSLRPAA